MTGADSAAAVAAARADPRCDPVLVLVLVPVSDPDLPDLQDLPVRQVPVHQVHPAAAVHKPRWPWQRRQWPT